MITLTTKGNTHTVTCYLGVIPFDNLADAWSFAFKLREAERTDR